MAVSFDFCRDLPFHRLLRQLKERNLPALLQVSLRRHYVCTEQAGNTSVEEDTVVIRLQKYTKRIHVCGRQRKAESSKVNEGSCFKQVCRGL